MSSLPIQDPSVDVREADPTKPVEADQTLGELLSRMTTDVSELVSTQIELAKLEIKEEVRKAGKGAGMLGGGAVAAYFGLLLLSFAVAWGLAEVMPPWVAFLIVAAAYFGAAAALYVKGREEINAIKPVAEQTVESLKEDVAWARRQKS